jgi:SAM-dependent methyltransferase
MLAYTLMILTWRKIKYGLAQWMHLDLTHSQVHYGRFLRERIPADGRWLEIGCGRQVVPTYAVPIQEQKDWIGEKRLIGIDVDEAIWDHPLLHDRVIGLGGCLPFQPGTMSFASCNMVMEHVDDPDQFLGDVYRVLQPGGRFVFHTPNVRYYLVYIAGLMPDSWKDRIVWVLEKRASADRFHTFYRINTEADIRRTAIKAGFEVESVQICGSSGQFSRLGPIGVMECLPLKLVASVGNGRYNSNILVSLRKPLATTPARNGA